MRVIATVIGEAAGVQPPPVTPTVEVHVCAGCRAPLVPVDAETMRCAFCGKDNPVPAELRREIQTAAAQDRAQAQMSGRVGRLLRHGRAHSANRAIRSFWWASQLVVPIGFAGLYFGRTAAPAIVMVAIAASAWALARVLVARRHALRALTLGCAAVTSFDPAKPPRCRRCLAPLPAGDATSGAATCTCAYCKAMNVLGVTLGETHRTVDESAEIADIMGKQRMATITSVAAVVIVTALAVFALR